MIHSLALFRHCNFHNEDSKYAVVDRTADLKHLMTL